MNIDDRLECQPTPLLVERVRQWISSEDGPRKLQQAADEAVDITNRLQQARQVDPKTLLETVTR